MYKYTYKNIVFIINLVLLLSLYSNKTSYAGINNLAPKSLNTNKDNTFLYHAIKRNLVSPSSKEPLLDINIVELMNSTFKELVTELESEKETPIIDIDSVFNNFLKKCIENTGAAYGSILLLNKEKNQLQFSYFTGPASKKLSYISIPSKIGISGQVLKRRIPIIVNQDKIDRMTSMIDDFTKLKTNNLFCFPIIIDAKIIGVIELINKKDKFTRNDVTSVNKLFLENLKEIKDAIIFQQQKELFLKASLNLADEIEKKSLYTRGHVRRVKKFALMIAIEMGLSNKEIDEVQLAAILHDVGKIKTPEEILNKRTKLTEEEFIIMTNHTRLGLEYLYALYVESVRFKNILNRFVNFKNIAQGVYLHHERPDGKGYPLGLFGDELPRIAKIIAVADIFDAMTSDRPYHKGISYNSAIKILIQEKEKQVCHEVVDTLVRALSKEKNIQTALLVEDLIQEALYPDYETSERALKNLSDLKNIKAKKFDRDYVINKQNLTMGFWELNYILGRENTTFIFDSLISNSLTHGGGDAVVILRSIEMDKIKLIIKDNGEGFDLNNLEPKIIVHTHTKKSGVLQKIESSLWKLIKLIVSEHQGKIIIKSQDKIKVFTPLKESDFGWNSIISETQTMTEGLQIEINIPFKQTQVRTQEQKPATLSEKFKIAS